MTPTNLGAWSCILVGKGVMTLAALRTLGLADPWHSSPLWPTGLALVGVGLALLWFRETA